MSEPEYKRLTRPRRRRGFAVAFVSRCSLWLAADHLLHIDSTGYSERYRRFYFRDIQAITLMRTHSWIYQLLAFGFFGASFVGIGLLIADAIAYWVFGVLAALLFAGVVYNVAAGPSCACEFRTAVQVEEIPSLGRVRRARRILSRIQPLIEQAQGTLQPGEVEEKISAWLNAEQPGLAPAATELEPQVQSPQPRSEA